MGSFLPNVTLPNVTVTPPDVIVNVPTAPGGGSATAEATSSSQSGGGGGGGGVDIGGFSAVYGGAVAAMGAAELAELRARCIRVLHWPHRYTPREVEVCRYVAQRLRDGKKTAGL